MNPFRHLRTLIEILRPYATDDSLPTPRIRIVKPEPSEWDKRAASMESGEEPK